jgi:hypothetical protein
MLHATVHSNRIGAVWVVLVGVLLLLLLLSVASAGALAVAASHLFSSGSSEVCTSVQIATACETVVRYVVPAVARHSTVHIALSYYPSPITKRCCEHAD